MAPQATYDGGNHSPPPAADVLEDAWWSCDVDPAAAQSSVDSARRGGLDLELAPAALAIESLLLLRRDDLAAALGRAIEADTMLASSTCGPWHHRLSYLLGDLHVEVGQVGAAFDDLFRAVAQAEEIDDPSGVVAGHRRLGRLLTSLGDHVGAAATFALVERLLDRGVRHEGAWLVIDKAELLAAEGRLEDANELLDESWDDVERCGPPAAALSAAGVRASIAAQLGRREESRHALSIAADLSRALGRSDHRALVTEARLAMLAGDGAAAGRFIERAVAGYGNAGLAVPHDLTRLRADLAAADGDHRSAYELLLEADDEEKARRARYPDRRHDARWVGHTTEFRRRLEALRRSNERLSTANENLRWLNDRVVEMSARDPLTGLVNRRQLFLETEVLLRLARRHGRPLAAAMVDIDRFKAVNDHHFHSTGDAVLTQVARLLIDGVRDSDLVGRYGGDEFVLLLPGVPAEGAAVLCERVRDSVADHCWDDVAAGLTVTVTIGIAEATAAESAEELLHRADQRLYLAKSLGRNQVAT